MKLKNEQEKLKQQELDALAEIDKITQNEYIGKTRRKQLVVKKKGKGYKDTVQKMSKSTNAVTKQLKLSGKYKNTVGNLKKLKKSFINKAMLLSKKRNAGSDLLKETGISYQLGPRNRGKK